MVAAWVYSDASSNGVDLPIVWAIVTFFMPIVGLLIYLVVRSTSGDKKKMQQQIDELKAKNEKQSGPIKRN